MKFHVFLFLCFLAGTLSAASTTDVPAPGPQAKALLDQIPLLDAPVDLSQTDRLKDIYPNYYSVRQTTVETLPDGKLAEIVPHLDDPSGKLVVEIRITKTGARNPAVLLETMTRVLQLTDQSSAGLAGPYAWIEALANREAGSLQSKERLARLDVEGPAISKAYIVKTEYGSNSPFGETINFDNPKINEYFDARFTEAKAVYDPIKRASVDDLRVRRRAQDALRPTFTSLEAESVKFDELIMRNDRQGVKRMLEAYLPWKLMEPVETRLWKDWIDAMVNPDPQRMKLVFRGMDDYPYMKREDGRLAMVSSVLAKNQGNYTRRLRSLTTLRDRIGSSEYNSKPVTWDGTTLQGNPSILNAMSEHASNPLGSPFLSVSDNATATSFGSRDRSALLIDERRLVPNLMAYGYSEKERLVPLVIFPDEIVHRHTLPPGVDPWSNPNAFNDEFTAKIAEKIGRPVTPEELNWNIDQEAYNKWSFERTKDTFLRTPPTAIIGENCAVDAAKVLDNLLDN